MATTTGYIAMADISGYTAFVAGTELEHSREILSELLDVTSRVLEQHLTPVRLQGDAIICVGSSDEIVPCLEAAFVAFHKRVRSMVAATTCPCNACQTVPSLTLKFIANHGTYSNVEVRGTKDLVGADVNIAFRLLKNHVPSHEYLLVTKAVMERLPEAARERFVPIVEEYDLGRVEAFYRDLHDLRERASQVTQLPPIERRGAHLRVGTTVDAPPEIVWGCFTDPKKFEQIVTAPSVTMDRGARGTLNGAVYHCHHGNGRETIFEVVGMREPNLLTLAMSGAGPQAKGTYYIEPQSDGRTRVDFVVRFDSPSFLQRLMAANIWRYYLRKGMGRLRALAAEGMAAATA